MKIYETVKIVIVLSQEDIVTASVEYQNAFDDIIDVDDMFSAG